MILRFRVDTCQNFNQISRTIYNNDLIIYRLSVSYCYINIIYCNGDNYPRKNLQKGNKWPGFSIYLEVVPFDRLYLRTVA